MDKRLVALIQRAVLSGEDVFPLNASWQSLYREYNVGSPSGNKIRLTRNDKDELAKLVLSLEGVDLQTARLDDWANLSRYESLEKGRQEKWAGKAVSSGRLAVKPLPEGFLNINGLSLPLPTRSHLDIAKETIAELGHDALIVVENYECFDRLDQIHLTVDSFKPIVVYRGDPNTSRADTVQEFLRRHGLPVLAMVDIDPAGLVIAQSLPCLAGILAPSRADLQSLLRKGNAELYRKQRPGAEQALRNSPYRLIRQLWQLIESQQAGLAQERWLQGDVEIVLHGLN